MNKIKLGIIGTADIAFRRFLPSLKKSVDIEYIGIASREPKKAEHFIQEYGGKIFESYDGLIASEEIDAVYIPLPPALHFEWAKKALKYNKHVFLEKPFTTNYKETQQLIQIAKSNKLALHENYMFQYHSQLESIESMIQAGDIGGIRQIRTCFGFPKRDAADFRYNKQLGGGAILDCGGYPVKLSTRLLGKNAKVMTSSLNYGNEFEVDIFGSATLQNDRGLTAQIAFGMENSYKCELEIWGSKGSILAPRIFTAPTSFKPSLICNINNEQKIIQLKEDDQFLKSINWFKKCITDDICREKEYIEILTQGRLIEEIIHKADIFD